MKNLTIVLIFFAAYGCDLQSTKQSKLQPESEPKLFDVESLEEVVTARSPTEAIVSGLRRLATIENQLIRIENAVTKTGTNVEVIKEQMNSCCSKQEKTAAQNPMRVETPKRQSSEPFTGALVYVTTDGSCPACDRILADLEKAKKSGWKVGTDPANGTNHFVIVEAAKGTVTPRVEYYKGGERFLSWDGYNGDLKGLLRSHPSAVPPKTKSRRSYRRTYRDQTRNNRRPVRVGTTYTSTPLVSRSIGIGGVVLSGGLSFRRAIPKYVPYSYA